MTSPTSERARHGLHALPDRPAWVRGATSMQDAEFLLDMVRAHAPDTIVELGVAAGVSSAYILYALDTLPDTAEGRLLVSCDIQPACYFNESHATGTAVETMYPAPRAQWMLDTNTDARRLSQTFAPASVDLTFIDANHLHPWPLLDVLHMSVLAKPGSWVMLHDINLPAFVPGCVAWGAKCLFDEWPLEKVAGGGEPRNIGAVKLPDDLTRLVPFAAALIERPWQFAPTLWHVALPEPFSAIQDMVRARIDQEPVRA